MDQIRRYLLSVIAAAILCGIVNTLIGKKGSANSVVKLIAGLFMAFTVISPLVTVRLTNISDYFSDLSAQGEAITADGEAIALEELCAIIKSRTEAYILDKAVSMDLDLEVEVTLSSENPPLPCAVIIKGSAAPYEKVVITEYIAKDLGISKEDQLWI
jgi:hypothetical protein